jgi:hypothetical protein
MNHGSNFITDFNGKRIEMKGREDNPYFMIEMSTTIREEKEENIFIITERQREEKNASKGEHFTRNKE